MSRKQKILKIIIILVVLIFFIYLIKLFFPLFRELVTEEGRTHFMLVIENMGVTGALLLISLMCIQILVPILPGEPIEILCGMCFGPIKGAIIGLIGAAISTICIVILVNLLGKSFIYTFINKEKVEKIENSKFFKNTKKIEILIIIFFIIPGTPKDLLVYIAALLPINIFRFLIISTIARIPSIISSTIAGSNLIAGNLFISIGVYIITFIITGIFIYIVNKKDKNIIEMVEEIS